MNVTSLLSGFGRRIRNLRTNMGLTQGQLAERSGLDVRYISRIENGRINVTLVTLSRLARAMRCPLLLSLPLTAGDEIEARVCSAISRLARENDTHRLNQIDKFVTHVMDIHNESGSGTCLIRKPSARR